MILGRKNLFVSLGLILFVNISHAAEEVAPATQATSVALPNYKSWKTPDDFEIYLEKALGTTSYNFTEMEDLVRDYFRIMLSNGEKFHIDEKISPVILHGPETLNKFVSGESYSTVCVGLARYMSDKKQYRRFSEILEDMRDKESRSKSHGFWEWVLSPITHFTSTSAGYRPVPAAVKSR
jgi:hypothetical protein